MPFRLPGSLPQEWADTPSEICRCEPEQPELRSSCRTVHIRECSAVVACVEPKAITDTEEQRRQLQKTVGCWPN